MARNKGNFVFSDNFEVRMAEALDPRIVVETKADLINKETWPYIGNTIYLYEGLVVAVKADKAIYMLVDANKITSADYSGWKQMDVAAAQTVEIIDNLNTQSASAALSANQGYVLGKKVDDFIAKFATVYQYKGSVANYEALPESAEAGDVYNVVAAHENYPAGTNWAWTGTAWDALGGSIDLSQYYDKTYIDENFVKKNEDGKAVAEGGLVIEKTDGTTVEVLSVEEATGDVAVGDSASHLKLEGSEARPSYKPGEGESVELALKTDVDTAKTEAVNAAKTYADEKFGAIDLSGYVEKETGKELIDSDKLALIDTNKSNIDTLRTDVDNNTSEIELLKTNVAKAAVINGEKLVVGVGPAEAAADKISVTLKVLTKDSTSGEYKASADEKLELVPATETNAGLMTPGDKNTLNTVNSDVTILKSTSEALTTSVNTLKGDENTEGSVKKISKDIAQSVVNEGLTWIEVTE